MMNEKMIMTG